MKIKRTAQAIKSYTDTLERIGLDYEIQHGTYTTKIKHANGTKTFSHIELSKRAFVAMSKIQRDVTKSEAFANMPEKKYPTINYDYNRDIFLYGSEGGVHNIDISSAYAHCLLLHGFISGETFDYITKSLPKSERLIVVGMLAKSYTKFSYSSSGKITNVDAYRSPTSNVFFFLIHEIDSVMKDCAFYLGKDFLFYWVDGIFFDKKASMRKISKVEETLQFYGYPYKWEEVREFYMRKIEDKEQMVVDCWKNKEQKQYIWGVDPEVQKIKTLIYEKHKYGKSVSISE